MKVAQSGDNKCRLTANAHSRLGGDHQIVYAKDVYNPAFRAIPTPGLSDAMAVQQINSVGVLPSHRNHV